jgi:thiamine biosynthesis lipoprotein
MMPDAEAPAVRARQGPALDSRAVAPRLVRAERIMGTVIRIELVDGRDRDPLVEQVFAWFREVDARFSLYRADSEMSRVARGELREPDAHPDIREVIDECEAVWVRSEGAFDIRSHRADGLLDPTGLVKGWSADRAGAMLLAAGVRDWSVNAGGDILVHGHPHPGQDWRIGIQHPRRREAIATVVVGSDLAVATSGDYERGDHIVDPRGRTAPGSLLSVTVVGPSLALADAYATAAFSMADEAPGWIASVPDYEGVVITAEDRVIRTEGMDRFREQG